MTMFTSSVATLVLLLLIVGEQRALSFQAHVASAPSPAVAPTFMRLGRRAVAQLAASAQSSGEEKMSDLDLKVELEAYLKVREEMKADEAAKREKGKVVGGTKGNAILEFVSGSPNKAFVIEEEPDIFDYDELTKYGFGRLVKPIMVAGGRREMYSLMGLPQPALPERVKPKAAPKLVIDRTGADDDARYSGLKMGQVLDDDELGRALAEAQRKKKAGESLRTKLIEEDYEMPFAEKRNVGPRQTPDWTPEQIDEAGRRAGRALAWARKARAGELRKDPYESLLVEGSLRWYCCAAAVFTSFAFGRSSDAALSILGLAESGEALIDSIQPLALMLVVAAVGSCVVSGAVIAPGKKRSPLVWGIKGLAGGPLAVLQLRNLDELKLRGESEE